MRRPATRHSRTRPIARIVVVDSSAVIAILFGETSADGLLRSLAGFPQRLMSVANYVEAGTVLAGRRHRDPMQALTDLDRFLDEAGIQLAPLDVSQAQGALQARIRHGRGMGHGGTLNFGDVVAYALAKAYAAPLLFVGDDFATTDITPAHRTRGVQR